MTLHQQFREDMKKIGKKPYFYRGRFWWKGPAVTCETHELQVVMSATKVPCQWDHMGKDLVVYPVDSA